MAVPEENSAVYRWLKKPVLKSRLLDDMEDPATWTHHGDGELRFTRERCVSGQQSIRLISPTKPDEFRDTGGRPFGTAHLRRRFEGEDWSEFNRLSFWVYPTAPGFYFISLLVQLQGSVRVKDQFEKDWLHHVLVKPGQWNQVVWEIAHLPRHHVTAVEFVYRLQGNEPGAAETVCFDFDRLELQYVEPDHFEGWNVAPGAVALSHTGYRPEAPKRAVGSGLSGDRFRVIDLATGEVLLTRPIEVRTTPLGTFQVMDFTDLRASGRYAVQVGETLSRPFRIDGDVWLSTVWKVLNFFYCERCGAEVPGIHGICHQDWLCTHADKRIVINGGWHDAGDLSQSAVNTAEAAYAMFSLAHRLRSDPARAELVERLVEEARWGLHWLLKTRFGDGYRSIWAVMDFWTDGVIGTVDDFHWQAENDPFTNFHAAAAEAMASVALREAGAEADGRLASFALGAAEEDYRRAMEGLSGVDVEKASAAVLAATELYKATGDRAYLDDAAPLARAIVQSQDREFRDWPYRLTGFFYTDPSRTRILHYPHLSFDQLPARALGQLCLLAPEHPDWMEWYTTVALYADFLAAGAELTAPYRMLIAGVYRLEDADMPTYEEQLRSGIRLDDRHFLRRFPAWTVSRGNLGILLSQANALSIAALVRRKPSLLDLAEEQLAWTVGKNPFAQSLMYGEGFDFQPQYSAMSGDIVGGLPVGIQTRRNEDVPYWPASNCYNYKEIWVHPASRWLTLVGDMEAARASGGASGSARAGGAGAGQEAARGSEPVAVAARTEPDGSVVLEITAREPLRCRLRSYNLGAPDEIVSLEKGLNRLVRSIADPKAPWLAVITGPIEGNGGGESGAPFHIEAGGLAPETVRIAP